MPRPDLPFHYHSRRALEEEIASITAFGAAAAKAHRDLSRLHAARACALARLAADGGSRQEPMIEISSRVVRAIAEAA